MRTEVIMRKTSVNVTLFQKAIGIEPQDPLRDEDLSGILVPRNIFG
jgi:hypothetical protein